MSLGIAIRAFFAVLLSRDVARRVAAALSGETSRTVEVGRVGQTESKISPLKPPPTARSEALTLLSTLQREARLVDLICEPLDEFSDAQIGAAAREVLRDSCQTLERLFGLTPLSDQAEGNPVELPLELSVARWRLIGKSQGTRGAIVHRGWLASRCELPQWRGDAADALVVTPMEIEVR